MADLGTVGSNSASAHTGSSYVPAPGGLTSAQYGVVGQDAEPLPFFVPPVEYIGVIQI